MENFNTTKTSTVVPEPTIALQRNLLGSIDLSDIDFVDEEEIMNVAERQAYCATIFAVFPRIEKDIKKFLKNQLLFSANQAGTWEEVIFGRGTFNGMSLLLEYWKKANEEHIANSKPEEEFNKNNPINEIE